MTNGGMESTALVAREDVPPVEPTRPEVLFLTSTVPPGVAVGAPGAPSGGVDLGADSFVAGASPWADRYRIGISKRAETDVSFITRSLFILAFGEAQED